MIANRIRSMFAATTLDPLHPRDPAIVKMLGGGNTTQSGVRVDVDASLGLATYWRGLNLICNGVAKPRAHIYRRTDRGKARDVEHENYGFVARRANPWMSAAQLRKTLQHHALSWGNGIAWLRRGPDGRIIEILPLPPDRTGLMQVDESNRKVDPKNVDLGDGELRYWTMIGGEPRLIDRSDVLHVHGLSRNGIWGYPVVEMLAESIGAAIAPRNFAAQFFGHGAMASGVIIMPPGLNEEQQRNFTTSLQTAHAGLGKQHRFMVLEEGGQFQQLSLSPEHAQMLQTREFSVRDIANVICIQQHKIGDPTKTSYASLEQSNQEHLDDDLDPWLQVWEEEYEEKLLFDDERRNETHFVEFNRKALLRTNLEARTSHYASGRQWGYYSANDVRRFESEDDIGSQGDIYLVPGNMMPADQASSLAGGSGALADWIVEDFARRLCIRSRDRAKNAKSFARWISEEIDGTVAGPDEMRDELQRVVDDIRRHLLALQDADDLAAAVAAAADDIAAAAVVASKERRYESIQSDHC